MAAKQTLFNWLAQDDLKNVLKELLQLADQYKHEQLRSDATFQSGRLKALEKQRLKDTISSDEGNVEAAKIRQALLALINDLPDNWTLKDININSYPSQSNFKINWKKYATLIAAAVLLLGSIAVFSVYNLKGAFNEKEKIEQSTITQPPLYNLSTTGNNSPIMITPNGDANYNNIEIKPKKDSTHKNK